MFNRKTKEHRLHQRYPMQWEVVLVFDDGLIHPKFQGRTHEVSVEGASILTDVNIFLAEPVTVLLAIPPLHTGQRKTIIEARGRMRYTVHSSSHGCFRVGIHFESFKSDGRLLLERSLSERAIVRSVGND